MAFDRRDADGLENPFRFSSFGQDVPTAANGFPILLLRNFGPLPENR